MSLHRRAAKRDAAEPAIVSALEALGCVVWRVSGKGLPDLIVLRAGKKWLADVKGPKEKPTPAQVASWTVALAFARCAVFILRTPEDAAAMLNNALQPWEPMPRLMRDTMTPEQAKALLRKATHGAPRKGDSEKVREEGLKRVNDEQWDVPLPDGRRLRNKPRTGAKAGRPDYVEAYTPPRSTPVDAAKEAEATFAPKALKHNPSCPDCVRMQRWCAGCCY